MMLSPSTSWWAANFNNYAVGVQISHFVCRRVRSHAVFTIRGAHQSISFQQIGECCHSQQLLYKHLRCCRGWRNSSAMTRYAGNVIFIVAEKTIYIALNVNVDTDIGKEDLAFWFWTASQFRWYASNMYFLCLSIRDMLLLIKKNSFYDGRHTTVAVTSDKSAAMAVENWRRR